MCKPPIGFRTGGEGDWQSPNRLSGVGEGDLQSANRVPQGAGSRLVGAKPGTGPLGTPTCRRLVEHGPRRQALSTPSRRLTEGASHLKEASDGRPTFDH